MLIRNARIEGYTALTDLRLMHGAVQEIGVGLTKGVYESELDLAGDELRPCPPGMQLPKRYARRGVRAGASGAVCPGTRDPLTRWWEGTFVGFIDSHSGD